MNELLEDHPRVVVFPPVNLIATIALGALLQWLMPLDFLAGFEWTWRVVIGATALVVGVGMALTGRRISERSAILPVRRRPRSVLALHVLPQAA